jgi:carboxymethylenebutenolidase
MSGKFLTCESRGGLMDVYVAAPAPGPRVPVVIVLQEAFGVNAHIRGICDRLASEGFLAAAPELFHRLGRRVEVPYGDRKLILPYLGKLTNADLVSDVRACINFLDNLPRADTSSVSIVGFCVGGLGAVLCGTKLGLKKIVSFYGAGLVHPREGIALAPLLNDLGQIKARCLFFFGGQDASIPAEDISEVEKKLTASKVPFEVRIFADADHGFFCDERKSYHPEAARSAWIKTVEFLKEEPKEQKAPPAKR